MVSTPVNTASTPSRTFARRSTHPKCTSFSPSLQSLFDLLTYNPHRNKQLRPVHGQPLPAVHEERARDLQEAAVPVHAAAWGSLGLGLENRLVALLAIVVRGPRRWRCRSGLSAEPHSFCPKPVLQWKIVLKLESTQGTATLRIKYCLGGRDRYSEAVAFGGYDVIWHGRVLFIILIFDVIYLKIRIRGRVF